MNDGSSINRKTRYLNSFFRKPFRPFFFISTSFPAVVLRHFLFRNCFFCFLFYGFMDYFSIYLFLLCFLFFTCLKRLHQLLAPFSLCNRQRPSLFRETASAILYLHFLFILTILSRACFWSRSSHPFVMFSSYHSCACSVASAPPSLIQDSRKVS